MKKSLIVIGLTLYCAAPVAAWEPSAGPFHYPDRDVYQLQQHLDQQRFESQRQFEEMNHQQREFEMQNQMRELQMQQQMILDYLRK